MPFPPDLRFQKLETADPAVCNTLSELHTRSFEEGWSPDSIASLIESQRVFGLIGFDESETCKAFALFLPILDECELISIATDEAARNKGLGRTILTESLTLCAEKHFSRVMLEVAEDNHPARKLYETTGFTQDGRRKGYYKRASEPDIDAILMSKPL